MNNNNVYNRRITFPPTARLFNPSTDISAIENNVWLIVNFFYSFAD